MYNDKKIVVIMPAYNAEKTLEKTFNEIDRNLVDTVILVDDASKDNTFELAKKLGIEHVIRHEKNKGYGGNQKTCYAKALEIGADVIVMLHPDYQYTPLLLPAIATPIANNLYDVMLGTRISNKGALKGGMPLYKFISNRFLSHFQNIMIGLKLLEYHTGYRAFSKTVFENISIEKNSDDFIFDNQMLAQIAMKGLSIGEVSCPTKYFDEASSINFKRSMQYGLGVVGVSIAFRLQKMGLGNFKIFS